MSDTTILEAHIGDVGTKIRLTLTDLCVAANLEGYTLLQIHLRSPSGNVKSLSASLVGAAAAGIIEAVTVAGTLDKAGDWKVQAYLESPTWKGHSSVVALKVYAAF